MSLETRSSEKVSYSNSTLTRLFFCNQLIKNSVFFKPLWAVTKTEKRTLTASQCLAVIEITYTYFISRCLLKDRRMGIAANSLALTQLSFVIKNLKNLRCASGLTEFYFDREVCKQKNIWLNLKLSQYLKHVVKMGSKPGKTLVIIKWLLWC